jgi:hypothetical protein
MEAIALGLNGFFILPLLEEMFSTGVPPHATAIKFGVGLNNITFDNTALKGGDPSLGGNAPHIALFDTNGKYLGETGNAGYIDDGSSASDANAILVTMNADSQAEYMALSAGGDDAICLSYITMTWPDSTRYFWSGDIGFKCGADWYPSNLEITSNNGGNRPKCTWIDGNHSNGLRYQGMSIHMSDFGNYQGLASEWNSNPALLCQSKPRFQMYPNLDVNSMKTSVPIFSPTIQIDANGDTNELQILMDPGITVPFDRQDADIGPIQVSKHRRRQIDPVSRIWRRNTQFMGEHLVTSHHDDHSAAELCGSESSMGPDFVAVSEGQFCDMATKELWPVCSDTIMRNCFDLNLNQIRSSLGRRLVDWLSGNTKSYRKFRVWGEPK